ncbi:Hypothetical predicted protein [Cloeon dipterum]|uniref:Neurotransmitter-gated ion-channel ligand-binding domain-containing protein n=4 Tax=Cloeon dipterum TaxID=197152 RepID=A0A8S1CCB9_9INSE|nr:Hypothetical predicted protein [Cloeon dipterum]
MLFGLLAPLLLFATAAIAQPSSCPPMTAEEAANMSTSELLLKLTATCRYDKWQRPQSEQKDQPIKVHAKVHVYFLGAIEAQSLKFTAHILLMFRWRDPRLAIPSGSGLDGRVGSSMGGQGLLLRDKIWVPHVYLSNERESVVMGAERKDVRITLHPDGRVEQALRMKVTLYCLMNLQKFPFDQQQCPLMLESWTYNSSELQLQWESTRPVTVNSELLLTEYRLIDTRTTSTEDTEPLLTAAEPTHPRLRPNDSAIVMELEDEEDRALEENEGLRANFSRLEIRFHLAREVGHYVMDYFMPSILLVAMSWVSFWLDPNAIPGRTTLGTSTMLTFITLTRNTGSALPKVSYIKATEVWFIVCTGFIFGSLLEFAFVNTIWRRKKEVPLKKVNSKYILKSTLTPRMARRQLQSSLSVGSELDRCTSWPHQLNQSNANQLTVHSMDSIHIGNGGGGGGFDSCDTLTSAVSAPNRLDDDCLSIQIPVPGDQSGKLEGQALPPKPSFTTMTPQEVAKWIDQRSRLWFPIAFLLFNALYWGFVWI